MPTNNNTTTISTILRETYDEAIQAVLRTPEPMPVDTEAFERRDVAAMEAELSELYAQIALSQRNMATNRLTTTAMPTSGTAAGMLMVEPYNGVPPRVYDEVGYQGTLHAQAIPGPTGRFFGYFDDTPKPLKNFRLKVKSKVPSWL